MAEKQKIYKDYIVKKVEALQKELDGVVEKHTKDFKYDLEYVFFDFTKSTYKIVVNISINGTKFFHNPDSNQIEER